MSKAMTATGGKSPKPDTSFCGLVHNWYQATEAFYGNSRKPDIYDNEVITKNLPEEPVENSDCCIALDDESNTLWVMLASTDASGVEYRNLSPQDRKVFDASRKLELTNLFDLGAYRILSLEESRRFRRETQIACYLHVG